MRTFKRPEATIMPFINLLLVLAWYIFIDEKFGVWSCHEFGSLRQPEVNAF
jgi:cell shape-determining protein MreD